MRSKAPTGRLGTFGRLNWLLKDPPQLQLFIVTDRRQHFSIGAEA